MGKIKRKWGRVPYASDGDSLHMLTVSHRKTRCINAVGDQGLFFKALTSFKVTPVTVLQHHNELEK